jgi:myo-inositol 2-dehydrogenase / D-chiro-inositol 1-dehydrogenase
VSEAPLRVAVLGAGRIGRLHAEVVAHRVPGAALVGVHDVDGAAAAEATARLGVAAAEDAAALIGSTGVDAVAICTSTEAHVELIGAAAEAGKAIFCEKPIAHDLAAVDRALAAVERAGVPFMVGFNRRFDAAHRSVRDAVASGAVGDVHILRITSRDPEPPPASYARVPGGMFLDTTVHDFDMARYVTGSEVREVVAHGAALIDPSLGAAGDVDTAVLVLVHESGTLTVIDNSRHAVYGYDQRVEAFGSAGMAASDNPPLHTGVVLTANGACRPPLRHFFLERYEESYVEEWRAFAAAVRAGVAAPVSGADGRAALVACLAAKRSLDERRPVRLDEIG